MISCESKALRGCSRTDEPLTRWHVFPLELRDLSAIEFHPKPSVAAQGGPFQGSSTPSRVGPVVFRGHFHIDSDTERGSTGHLPDTYVSMRKWGKGLAFVNGFNLGWYWPSIGPQGAQYIPGPLLKGGSNEIILVEVENAPRDATVELTSKADLSGPTSFLGSSKEEYIGSQPAEEAFNKGLYLPSSEEPWKKSREGGVINVLLRFLGYSTL